ncbi:MAG: hypothetical protein R3E86_12495 [Pseudomonadales bacterium]
MTRHSDPTDDSDAEELPRAVSGRLNNLTRKWLEDEADADERSARRMSRRQSEDQRDRRDAHH